jgi:type I restriction enzyme R subunit
MIVTFRKPVTMAGNERAAIKLFSNEARDWESLVPREYSEVKAEYQTAFKAYQAAQRQLEEDPGDLKKKIEAIKTFQTMKHLGEAIKSYEGYADEYEEDAAELTAVSKVIAGNVGHIENLKAEVKRELEKEGAGEDEIQELFEIEFSADQRANLEETIDSYYISQLLKDIKNEDSKRKFNEIIETKPEIVKTVYDEALGGDLDEGKIVTSVDRHFKQQISKIIMETVIILKVPQEDLNISFNEYRLDRGEVPYINTIIDKSELTREDFEAAFPGELFRRKRIVVHDYLKTVFTDKLMPLREELANFNDEGDL